MSGVETKDSKDFTTITNLRKVAQEIMRPFLDAIQKRVDEVYESCSEVQTQQAQISSFLVKCNSLHSQVDKLSFAFQQQRDKQQIEEMKQAEIQRQLKGNIGLVQEQIKAIVKNQEREAGTLKTLVIIVKAQNDKFERVASQFTSYKQSLQTLTEQNYAKQSQFLSEAARSHESMLTQSQQNGLLIDQLLNQHRKRTQAYQNFEKRVTLFDSQRLDLQSKLFELSGRMDACLTREQYGAFKQASKKYLQNAVESVKSIIDQALSPETRMHLGQLGEKMKFIGEITNRLKQFELSSAAHSQQALKIVSDLNEAEVRMADLEIKLSQQREQILALNGLSQNLSRKIDSSSEENASKIKALQNINSGYFNELQKNIKKDVFNELKEALDSVSSAKIANFTKAMDNKIEEATAALNRAEQTADGVEKKLHGYYQRVVTLRGDNEVFIDNVHKELKVMANMKAECMAKMQDLGKVVSSVIEAVTMLSTMNVHLFTGCDDSVYVTYEDGIIYNRMEDVSQPNSLLYRRKWVQIQLCMKALLTALGQLVDQTKTECEAIKWTSARPSLFFEKTVLNAYERLKEVQNKQQRAKGTADERVDVSAQNTDQLDHRLISEANYLQGNLNTIRTQLLRPSAENESSGRVNSRVRSIQQNRYSTTLTPAETTEKDRSQGFMQSRFSVRSRSNYRKMLK